MFNCIKINVRVKHVDCMKVGPNICPDHIGQVSARSIDFCNTTMGEAGQGGFVFPFLFRYKLPLELIMNVLVIYVILNIHEKKIILKTKTLAGVMILLRLLFSNQSELLN